MKNFNVLIDKLELRTCAEYLLPSSEPCTAEIVLWYEQGLYYTIMYWKKTSEGYDLVFVGDRPFDYPDVQTLWKLMKIGQDFLEDEFNECRDC